MKKLIIALLLAVAPVLVQASSEGGALMDAREDPNDIASIQRGAKYFVSYCAGCHSAKYIRFNRIAQDLNIPEDLVEQYLIYTDAKIGETMESAMQPAAGQKWFGKAPPDLTLTARVRGADWIYTYLNSFYADPKSATGWNNLVFPSVAMPHVLWPLQGVPQPKYEEVHDKLVPVAIHVEDGEGVLSTAEYRAVTRDLTNFLAYIAEPMKAERQELGIKVILFLLLFFGLAYLLKKEYWKDVH